MTNNEKRVEELARELVRIRCNGTSTFIRYEQLARQLELALVEVDLERNRSTR